eukprot:75776-Chlamydomonas_euryale.AAC.1
MRPARPPAGLATPLGPSVRCGLCAVPHAPDGGTLRVWRDGCAWRRAPPPAAELAGRSNHQPPHQPGEHGPRPAHEPPINQLCMDHTSVTNRPINQVSLDHHT